MALDLSSERYGSKATPDETYHSIMEEAARITQRKEDAKAIAKEVAKEVIKELEKWEQENESQIPETVPAETVEVIVVQEPEPNYTIPIVASACSFFVGMLVTSLFFIARIRQIRKEHETW